MGKIWTMILLGALLIGLPKPSSSSGSDVGVKVGDFLVLEVRGNLKIELHCGLGEHTGDEIGLMTVNITDVEGYDVTMHIVYGTIGECDYTCNILAYNTTGIIRANLSEGDLIWNDAPYIINRTEVESVLGVEREVNYLEISWSYYGIYLDAMWRWDRYTGCLVEFNLTYVNSSGTYYIYEKLIQASFITTQTTSTSTTLTGEGTSTEEGKTTNEETIELLQHKIHGVSLAQIVAVTAVSILTVVAVILMRRKTQ